MLNEPRIPCRELHVASVGARGGEGHVHGRERAGVVLHVQEAHQPGHVVLIDLNKIHE